MMLEVLNIDFDYSEKPLLNAVQFLVGANGFMHLRGANGSGKSTLLKLMAGLLHPLRGEIRYDGQNIAHDLNNYRQHLCYVGHKSGVSTLLTVREQYQFELNRGHSNSIPIEELMDLFALTGQEDVLCGLLSAGQRRRVGLLRLFLTDALLWLLDEPLVALDQEGIALLISTLNSHLAKGGQVILTSHQPIPRIQASDVQEYCL